MSVEKVYEYLSAAGSRVVLPGPWQGLPCHRSFFQLPPDSRALLQGLQKKFEVNDLVDSGVVQLDEQGVAVINPLLSSADTIIWALRQRRNDPPFQLVANLKSIHPKKWSFTAPFFDGRTVALINQSDDRVAVAFSMSDIAILSSLKIPVVPVDGLLRLPGNRLDQLCKLLRLESKTDAKSKAQVAASGKASAVVERPLSLTLYAWSVESLKQSDSSQSDQLWKYLGDLQEHLRLPLYDFQRLNPTEQELARLRFIIQHRRWWDVRAAMLDGPYERTQSLFTDKSRRRPFPDSLSEVLKAWRRTQNQISDVASRKAAWNLVQSVHDQQIVAPLTDQAQRTNDPTERNLLTLLAGMSRLLHPQLLMLGERAGQAVGERGTNALNAIPKDEFQQVMAVADRVMALTQGVQACRQKKPFQIIGVPRPKPMKAASKESGSTPTKSPPFGGKGS